MFPSFRLASAALLLAGLLPLAGCGAEGPTLAVATVDTLANGTISIRSDGPTAWADTNGWRLVELYRVGGTEEMDDAALINPQSAALTADGGLFVADSRPAVLKQYDAQGRFVRTIGRQGSGPGEFRVGFITTTGGHLVLHDPQNARTTVFDTAGGFVRGWPSACCYWSLITADRTGHALIPAGPPPDSPYRQVFLRYAVDGTLADTLYVPKGETPTMWVVRGGSGGNSMQMMMSVPLSPRSLAYPHPAGGLVLGWTGAYRFALSPNGRDTSRIIERAAQPVAVTSERRRHIVDSVVENLSSQFSAETAKDAVKESELPSTAAYYTSVAIDGAGRFWVQPDDGGDTTARRFDVFSAEGAWLGSVPVPATMSSAYRTTWGPGDRLASMGENEDGLPIVVVYRIDTTLRSAAR